MICPECGGKAVLSKVDGVGYFRHKTTCSQHIDRAILRRSAEADYLDMILIAGEGLDALGGAYVLRLSELDREPDDLALAG